MTIYLGLGSNLTNRLENLQEAVVSISSFCTVKKVSSVYETISMLKDDQQNYYNCIVMCESENTPHEILTKIKKLEIDLGRICSTRWGERLIDIDIIDYGGTVLNSDVLTLPHAGMHCRSFVLYPMRDVIDNYLHPIYNISLEQMIYELTDDFGIKKIESDICL